ncbi:hypothetical protein NBRC116583_32760 [Arenicella sp. 4NH20-0111]|uniref:TetR/AcrR family transcriptional regulator n=1 Tax=Arenicella sp. 4NH20-0111 TaxID=3127648 RepID=UPI00310A2D81
MPRPAITEAQRLAARKKIKEAASRLSQSLSISYSDTQEKPDFSVRAVSKEAGISVGSFYKYYENLEDLIQSLWADPVSELKLRMQKDVKVTREPTQRIRLLLRHYHRFSIENRKVFRGAFMFVRPDKYAPPTSADLKDEDFYVHIKQALIDGQKLGIYRDFDADKMTCTFWAGIHGSLTIPVNFDRFDFGPTEELVAHMIDSLLHLIQKP